MSRLNLPVLLVVLFSSVVILPATLHAQWKQHAMDRPAPPVVTPAPQHLPVAPPSDAIILFDGDDLDAWERHIGGPGAWTIAGDYMEVNQRSNEPAPWTVGDGYFQVAPGTGDIRTKAVFGDIQLHVEWATPPLDQVQGEGQDRGNSGIFLMGLYEVQVLDSYESSTYPDGQAAAIYGQYPPLVNASRPPTEWQSYDIVFRRPRFETNGKLLAPARITVWHNGVLVQDASELWGVTMWLQHIPYRPHAAKLPLTLQDHGNPVRFRNMWVRELQEEQPTGPMRMAPETSYTPSSDELDRYVGEYEGVTIHRVGDHLRAHFFGPLWLELQPVAPGRFLLRRTDALLNFTLDADGHPTAATFTLGGSPRTMPRRN